MKDFGRFVSPYALGLALGLASLPFSISPLRAAETHSASSPAPLRISPSQYRQTIADVFGLSISINGRFEPEIRDDGLLAVGEARASFSDAGVERYDELARGIAAQVVDARHRDVLIPCKPQSSTDSDSTCAHAFFSTTGRMLFRRALAEDEIKSFVDVANRAAATKHDFYAGISAGLAVMLVSPEFLFRFRETEPDPSQPGRERLNSYAKATVLSFFLWNSSPDGALLKAAEKGELQTKEGLRRQVDRMVSSPALKAGVRAFFSDMLGFDQFEILSKDPTFFPDFTIKVKVDAEEQTLLTIVDHLITRQGDYRDLLTTPHTFLTRSLASLYGVPLMEKTDNGQPMHWQAYTYPDGDPRAGLLAQASFVALFSPAGRTSPTGRGKALREHLLCQIVPPPPANVDFSLVQNASNPVYKTARDRLTAHRSNPVCAGCHRITDPIGLALENFDSSGGYRTTENGVPIDTSGDLNGIKFTGPVGLSKALHDDPAVTACVANKAYAFAAGQLPAANDPEWAAIQKKFAESHYNFVELLRQIAMSELLYALPAPQTARSN